MRKPQREVSLPDVLKRRRKQLELTQQQVADRAGCRANYIGYLETGARHPSSKLLLKLAGVLDLDARELFFLANPAVGQVMDPRPNPRASAWEKFRANKGLHTRHGITRDELQALERVATLGPVRRERDFLFILQTIRQAIEED